MSEEAGRVGVFWGVYEPGGGQRLVAEHISLDEAELYGDCFTFPDGHAEVWDRLRTSGMLPCAAKGLEYDAVPRGRVVYSRSRSSFWLYADRRLQAPRFVAELIKEFCLIGQEVSLRLDDHYR